VGWCKPEDTIRRSPEKDPLRARAEKRIGGGAKPSEYSPKSGKTTSLTKRFSSDVKGEHATRTEKS